MTILFETTVTVMYPDIEYLVSMLPFYVPIPRFDAFREDDRAMSELAVLGILLGTAVILASALAVFMLFGR